jgi:hypothetical protein
MCHLTNARAGQVDGDLKDTAETSKELLAAVIEARPSILFDNCKRHLESPYLAAFVTAAVWSGRILGVSSELDSLLGLLAGKKLRDGAQRAVCPRDGGLRAQLPSFSDCLRGEQLEVG